MELIHVMATEKRKSTSTIHCCGSDEVYYPTVMVMGVGVGRGPTDGYIITFDGIFRCSHATFLTYTLSADGKLQNLEKY